MSNSRWVIYQILFFSTLSDYVDYMMYVKLCAGFPQYGGLGAIPPTQKIALSPNTPSPCFAPKIQFCQVQLHICF